MVRNLVQSARWQRAQQIRTSRRRPARSRSRRGQKQFSLHNRRIPLLQGVAEALRRLPQELTDARLQRLKRATDLSMKHIYLSPELQAKQTPFEPYLQVSLTQSVVTLELFCRRCWNRSEWRTENATVWDSRQRINANCLRKFRQGSAAAPVQSTVV